MHPTAPQRPDLAPQENPCIHDYGPGRPGEKCGSCLNLAPIMLTAYEASFRSSDPPRYYCKLDGTPRRVTSPSCAAFVLAPLVATNASG